MKNNKRTILVFLIFLAFFYPSGTTQTLLAKKAQQKAEFKSDTKRFVGFNDAEYRTSPDKRIGAKILADSVNVGPSIASLVHLTFLPGAHIGSHKHLYVTEIVYVLDGSLTLRIEDEIKILGPNSTAFIPPQAFHEYLNDSADVVKFLQYFSPSGPEEEYRNWQKPSDTSTAKSATPEPETQKIIIPPMPPVRGVPRSVISGVEHTPEQETEKD